MAQDAVHQHIVSQLGGENSRQHIRQQLRLQHDVPRGQLEVDTPVN